MKRLVLLLCCGSLGVLAQAAAAQNANLPPVVDNAMYPGGGRGYAAQSPIEISVNEALAKIEQLQTEVQQLRGMVEEQMQTIADLQKKQSNMYTDLDQRLEALSGGATATAASPASPDANNSPPAQAATPNAAPPTAAESTQPPAQAAASANAEQDHYQAAYETLRSGRAAEAIVAFQALLTQYPAGKYVDNAQYWLGEAYLLNRDPNAAKTAFNKILSSYPNSAKVPDALLKLGYIEIEQSNPTKARDYFSQVITGYPQAPAAALATKKLAAMPR